MSSVHQTHGILRSLLFAAFFLINAVLLILGVVVGKYFYEGWVEKKQLEANVSAAIAPPPIPVQIDYSSRIATGSPLVFGGAHYPPVEHQDAWDKIADAGVTSVRVDFFIERYFPGDMTLADYRDNKNGIQDPQNWNRAVIEEKKRIFQNARSRGLKVIGIMDYAPVWLTHNGKNTGVPRDWDVYRDVVEKTYYEYKGLVDYLEIWNEPNLPHSPPFLDTTGTDMTKIQAYQLLFENAARAIRNVESAEGIVVRTPIGGPVSYSPMDASFLEPLLKSETTSQFVDFVSYHQYEQRPILGNRTYTSVLDQYGKAETPIFITEWNYSWRNNEMEAIVNNKNGIPYTSTMLLNYLKDGIYGANFHTVTGQLNDKANGVGKNHAFYQWDGSTATLLPLASSWRLMSRTLGLGAGFSHIHWSAAEESSLTHAGFMNSYGQKGAVIINPTDNDLLISLQMSGLEESDKWQRALVYNTSSSRRNNTESVPVFRRIIRAEAGNARFSLIAPARATTGVLFVNDVRPVEKIRYRILYR